MSKMGLHHPFGHVKHKLWPKERSGVKLAVWLLTTKSRKSTQFPYVRMTCDIPLESSWQGLQLCTRPYLHRRSVCKVMAPQSCGSPNLGNFGTPTWEFRTKSQLDVGLVERRIVYYKGRWWLPPSLGCGESCVSNCSWPILAPKVLQLCTNYFVLVFVQACVSK